MLTNEYEVEAIDFKDEGEITLKDLITSPALKITYGRFISASNWIRWQLC